MSNIVPMNQSSEGGSLTIQSMDDLARLAKMMANSGFFKDTTDAAKAGVKILAGRELGVGAFVSMSEIRIIQGRPCLSANLMGAMVKGSPRYNWRLAKDSSGNPLHSDSECAIDFFERAGQSWELIGRSVFTMEDARQAGLSSDTWKKYPRNMLFARAMSNGCRWYCSDVFLGASVYTPEEMDAIDVSPQPTHDRATQPQVLPVTIVDVAEELPPSKSAVKSAAVPALKSPSNIKIIKGWVEESGLKPAAVKEIRIKLLGDDKEMNDYTADEMGKLKTAIDVAVSEAQEAEPTVEDDFVGSDIEPAQTDLGLGEFEAVESRW